MLLLLFAAGGLQAPIEAEYIPSRGNIMGGFAGVHFAPIVPGVGSIAHVDFTPHGGLHTVKRIDTGVY